MDRKARPRYDEQKRSKANISAVLRFIVAFYLAYLGWTIARGGGGEDGSMEPWLAWLICGVFCAVGIGFGVYALNRYQAELKAAELPDEAASGGDADEREEDPPS